MTILTSLLAATNFRNPFLRNIVPSVGLAFGLQAAVAIPSILAQSERFYDLSGSLTYLSCTALSLYLPALRARSAAAITGAPKPAWPSLIDAFKGTGGPLGFNWRQAFLSAAVSLWATRRELPFPLTYRHTNLPQSALTSSNVFFPMARTRVSRTSETPHQSSSWPFSHKLHGSPSVSCPYLRSTPFPPPHSLLSVVPSPLRI
jgi:hypothetical protein